MLTEMRPDMQIEHALVGILRGCALAFDVLGLEPLDQLGRGRRSALVFNVPERTAALSEQPLEPLGLGARCSGLPVLGRANGEPTLAPRSGRVIQDEGS